MRSSAFQYEKIVWLLLVSLTFLSWWLGEQSVGYNEGNLRAVTTILMLVGFFKVRLVGLYFMELHRAPWPLRLSFETWIVVTCAVILILYWGPSI